MAKGNDGRCGCVFVCVCVWGGGGGRWERWLVGLELNGPLNTIKGMLSHVYLTTLFLVRLSPLRD